MSGAELRDRLLALTGCNAFTLLLYDKREGVAHRVFSSCPSDFPAQGTKPLKGAVWAEHMMSEKTPLVCLGPQAIRASFEDHELINDLGIKSIINFPVLRHGKCIGSVNCLYIFKAPVHANQSIIEKINDCASELLEGIVHPGFAHAEDP